MIQRNLIISNYFMIPAIRWSLGIRWSPAIWWPIGSMDFDSPKVYGDTFISDGLVTCICQSCSIHIFFTIEEDISFLGWTRWKLLGIPWKSGRKRFVGSAPRLLIFHAAAYFEPRKNKTPLLAQKRHHHHFHRHRRLNFRSQNEYSKVMFLDTKVFWAVSPPVSQSLKLFDFCHSCA